MVEGFLIVAAIIAVATLFHGLNAYLITAATVSAAAVVCYVACFGFVRRHVEDLELRHLYLSRVITFASFIGLLLTICTVLHQFVAFYDDRLAVDLDEVVATTSLGFVVASAVFIAVGQNAVRRFVRWVAARSSEGRKDVSIDELDTAYGRRIPPPVSGAVSAAAALFGAFVVAKTALFPLIFFAAETFVGLVILYGGVKLMFEVSLFLMADKGIRRMRVHVGAVRHAVDA